MHARASGGRSPAPSASSGGVRRRRRLSGSPSGRSAEHAGRCSGCGGQEKSRLCADPRRNSGGNRSSCEGFDYAGIARYAWTRPAVSADPARRLPAPRRRSDGEALATLAAATRKDLTAVLGAHPLAKAVRLLAATIVGLKRALHGSPPFVRVSTAVGPGVEIEPPQAALPCSEPPILAERRRPVKALYMDTSGRLDHTDCGELGIKWRRGWDSNPRYPFGYNGFRDRPDRPLRHLSSNVAKDWRRGWDSNPR